MCLNTYNTVNKDSVYAWKVLRLNKDRTYSPIFMSARLQDKYTAGEKYRALDYYGQGNRFDRVVSFHCFKTRSEARNLIREIKCENYKGWLVATDKDSLRSYVVRKVLLTGDIFKGELENKRCVAGKEMTILEDKV